MFSWNNTAHDDKRKQLIRPHMVFKKDCTIIIRTAKYILFEYYSQFLFCFSYKLKYFTFSDHLLREKFHISVHIYWTSLTVHRPLKHHAVIRLVNMKKEIYAD